MISTIEKGKLVKKRVTTLLIIASLLLVFSFITTLTTPSAYASTLHNSKPFGHGGGCSGSVVQGPPTSFAKYSSCISEAVFQQVAPDSYFTFGATNSALWSSCTATIDVLDNTINKYIETYSVNCLTAARTNAQDINYSGNIQYGTGGHEYYTRVGWYGVYSGKAITGEYLFSPAQFV